MLRNQAPLTPSSLKPMAKGALIVAGLLAVAAMPAAAQDLCIETDFNDNVLTWDFYRTGSNGPVRTIAGIRRSNEIPADGSVHISGDATVRWTAHFGNFGASSEVRFFRCNLDLDTLTGNGERVDIQSGESVVAILGTCSLVDC